jgi:serine/threonine-protein kinase
MGVVYKASHTRLPGRFAVKLLKHRLANHEEALRRFFREAAIMGGLHHPNVVQIVDFNHDRHGRPYFVMEYLEGETLEAHLATGVAFPLKRVLSIVRQIAAALTFAHKHGVVHRDVKPANVFLVKFDGQTEDLVKVLDFGISQSGLMANQGASGFGLLGTPQYMAPEQALGKSHLDGRADQFSLAAVAYIMLTGCDAFAGSNIAALMFQVVNEPPRSIPWLLTGNAIRVEKVLFRALSKEPDARFDSVVAFARALSEAAGEPQEAEQFGDPIGESVVLVGRSRRLVAR